MRCFSLNLWVTVSQAVPRSCQHLGCGREGTRALVQCPGAAKENQLTYWGFRDAISALFWLGMRL